jgi:hypothetical protein
MPKIGTKGTSGALNGRLISGSVFLKIITPALTKIKASNVPILVKSPATLPGTNPANAPECQFACYDIEVVKRETVGMLYNIPGQNANRSKLTTPPVAIDACGPVSRTFEDRITSTNCGASKLIRDWKFTDAMGNTT